MGDNERIDKRKVAKSALIGAIGTPMMATGITAAFDKMDGNSIRKSIKDTAKDLKHNKVARYSMLGGSLASAAALGAHSALSQKRKQTKKSASDLVDESFEKMAIFGFNFKPKEFSQEEKNKMIQRIKTDNEFKKYVTWDYGVNFDACTPQDWNDVAEMLLEDKHSTEKSASDLVNDNFEKIAVSADDILATDKRKNEAPSVKGFTAALKQPENFAKGYKVRTNFYPTMHDRDELGYQVTSTGFGRRNQQLTAETSLRDLVELSKKDDNSKAEYLSRISPHKEGLYDAENSSLRKLLSGAGAGAVTGLLAGALSENKQITPITTTLGLMSGAGLGMLKGNLGEKRARRKLLEALTPEEREYLADKKDNYAERQSQNAQSAQKLTGYNTYYY